LAGALMLAGSVCAYAQDAAEVGAVVAAVKAKNADIKKLCQGGPDAVRGAVGEATTELAKAGKIKGDPKAVGAAAGQAIGKECRG
jgi:hypothetical protein